MSIKRLNTLYIDHDVVDLSSATEDYPLAVGEQAILSYADVTVLPLHVATDEGLYNLKIVGSGATISGDGTYTALSPNNISANISMEDQVLVANNNGAGAAYNVITSNGFPIGTDRIIYSNFDVVTFLKNKSVFGVGAQKFSIYDHHIGMYGTKWTDTTTPWTSLGTLRFASAHTGKVIITRTA